ncbi:hypothetical protein [Pectobacterium carotovorum]|uniref:hypothetical protein n=1 Tax=Pectobacterium carotovorum TaxID=554 RepID=UPI00058000EF|nr:hypothetical protein [Pectobacterium carotovorum]KHT27163.1 hypothetical protein RC99_19680 [Pectobacterium carotovorum subsp. carotovorum]MBA0179880.1 hypothetical protein [Pectobacterium carotovorum]MBA0194790.1 hypothetical protein [Pectobacterium carotovorum]MBA0202997.1 hypothetical protein [Pectobacterium carotovorum]RJL42650.1 hypothetical protein D5078_17110 [Pectobacterium carotovorum]
MKISNDAVDRLLKIDWFANVGNQCFIPNVKVVASLNDANFSLSSPDWENVTLEESNEISGYLAVKHTVIFQDWNDLAQEAKSFLKDKLLKQIPHLNGFDNVLLLQCIEWDVVSYLIEDAYKDKIKKPLFFDSLIHIYESGHIPCGWDGVWPNGKLVVY